MVLKLYGFPLSSWTQGVIVTLKELGIPYEFVSVNLFTGEQKNPEYMKIFIPLDRSPFS